MRENMASISETEESLTDISRRVKESIDKIGEGIDLFKSVIFTAPQSSRSIDGFERMAGDVFSASEKLKEIAALLN